MKKIKHLPCHCMRTSGEHKLTNNILLYHHKTAQQWKKSYPTSRLCGCQEWPRHGKTSWRPTKSTQSQWLTECACSSREKTTCVCQTVRTDSSKMPTRSEEHTSELQSRQYLVC